MQLFVRSVTGSSFVMDVNSSNSVAELKEKIQEACGVSADSQLLVVGNRMFHNKDASMLGDIDGIHDQCSIHVACRMQGGKPVKVKMMTNHLPCGPEVTIDIDENASKDEIKMKLAEKTGVPIEHQKVMLSGINQIVMGDKRTNIGYSSCGYTSGVQLAVENSK